MPDPIFERYKEALRAGHVAALRGNPDQALIHYRRAAALAPDRGLPHISMAEVLEQLGRRDEAVAASGRAVTLAPRDPSVLETAARVYVASAHPDDAAACLDRLADVLADSGAAAEAHGAAARALDIAPSRQRRDRTAAFERAAANALAPAREVDGGRADGAAAGDGTGSGVAAAEHEPERPGETPAGSGAQLAGRSPADEAGARPDVTSPEVLVETRASGTPVPEAAEEMSGAAPTAIEEMSSAAAAAMTPASEPSGAVLRPDPELLFVEAEERAAAGDPPGAARLYADAAEAYLAMGAEDTAVDACLRALAAAPGDTGVHLALARIHLATGHLDRAERKLSLLRRLRELEGDEGGAAFVAAFREANLGR